MRESDAWDAVDQGDVRSSFLQSSHVVFTWLEFLLHSALIEIACRN